MLNIELEKDTINSYELDVIEGYAHDFLLPASVVRTGIGAVVRYDTEGYVPLCAYGFRSELFCVFRVLKNYVRCIAETKDKLLRPDMLFGSGDMIFISPESGAVRLVYGEVRAAADEHVQSYGDIVRSLMPLLSELSDLSSIVGAKSAMKEIAKHIRAHNPGYHSVLKIIEQVERKWNYVQPVRP